MDSADDILPRVQALRDPEGFLRQVRELLDRQERADARHPAEDRQRQAWAALDLDLASRYADAIGAPWAQLLVLARPTPQLLAAAAEQRERLDQLMSRDPGAVTARARLRAQWQDQVDELERARLQAKATTRDRLAAAGLPFLPDLFLPEDLP
ncbi:hypothetical protein [Actinoplanes sp. NPDC026670]|uniref:hypothetical protein n=1 Tax=Actinoplanes sp. NPDC026670 TaxID=3154700 RepID=UPI0033FD354C